MEDEKIKIYVIGVGNDWAKTRSTPLDLERFAVDRLHGTVITAGNEEQLKAAFTTIDRLEKSTESVERPVAHKDVYEYFAAAAAVCLLLYVALCAVYRQNP